MIGRHVPASSAAVADKIQVLGDGLALIPEGRLAEHAPVHLLRAVGGNGVGRDIDVVRGEIACGRRRI